jgi:hypothetical protein
MTIKGGNSMRSLLLKQDYRAVSGRRSTTSMISLAALPAVLDAVGPFLA